MPPGWVEVMDGPGAQLRSSAVMSGQARWRYPLGKKTLTGYKVRKGTCVCVCVCGFVFVNAAGLQLNP